MSADLAPYPSPAARDAWLRRAADAVRGEVLEIGRSVEGRALLAARVPATGAAPALCPRLLLCANIHGVELIACRVALGFLDALAAAGRAAALRARAELWVVPAINPDGYARTWERGGVGKLRELRPNAHGVDLNRNFPLPGPQPTFALSLGGWATGSADKSNPFYRGEHPLSEPEAAAMDALFSRCGFHASVSLHSCMGRLIPAHVDDRASFAVYRELCAAFGAAQPRWRYRRTASRRFDWFTGEQEDHQHHVHRTWAITAEIFPLGATYRQHLRAPSTFWRFNPRDPQPWVDNDVPGIAAYFAEALARHRP